MDQPEPKPFYHQHHSSKKKKQPTSQALLRQARLPADLTRKTTITSRRARKSIKTKQQTLSFKPTSPKQPSQTGQHPPIGINIETQCSPLTYQRIHTKEKIQQLNRTHGGWIEEPSAHKEPISDHADPVENHQKPLMSSPTYCNTSPTPEPASKSFMDDYPMEELSETEDEDTSHDPGQSGAPSRRGEPSAKKEKVILCPESLDRQKYPSTVLQDASQQDSHPDIRAGHIRLQKAMASQDHPVQQAQESFLSESQTGHRSHSCALFFEDEDHQPRSPVEQSHEDHGNGDEKEDRSPTTHILCPESLDNQLHESYLAPSQPDDNRTQSCALFYDDFYSRDEADREPPTTSLTTKEQFAPSAGIDPKNPADILCPSSLPSQHPHSDLVLPESLLLETQDRSFSCALFFHGDDDDDHHRAHEIEKTRLDNSENGETHSSQDTKEAGKKRIVLAEESQELIPGPSTSGHVQNNHSNIVSRDSEETGREKIVLAEESQEMSPGPSVSGHRSLAPPTPISARRATRPSFSTFSGSGFVPSPSSSSSLTRNTKRKSPNPSSSTSVTTDGSQKQKKGKKSIDPFDSHVRPAWTTHEQYKVPKLHPPTFRQIGLSEFLVPLSPSVNNNNNKNNNSNGSGSQNIHVASQKDRAPVSCPLPLEFTRFTNVARCTSNLRHFSEKSQIGKGKDREMVEVEDDEIIVSDDENKLNRDNRDADKSNDKEEEDEEDSSSSSSSPSVHMIPDSQPTSVLVPSSPPLPSVALDNDHTINNEELEEEEGGGSKVVKGFRERIRLAREREHLCRWALHEQADRESDLPGLGTSSIPVLPPSGPDPAHRHLPHPLHSGLQFESTSEDRKSGEPATADLDSTNEIDTNGNQNQQTVIHRNCESDPPKHDEKNGNVDPESAAPCSSANAGRICEPDGADDRQMKTGPGSSLSVSGSSSSAPDVPSVPPRRRRRLTPSSSSPSAIPPDCLVLGSEKSPWPGSQGPTDEGSFDDVDRILGLLANPLPSSSSSSSSAALPPHQLVDPCVLDTRLPPSPFDLRHPDPSKLDIDRFVARYKHLLLASLLTSSSSSSSSPPLIHSCPSSRLVLRNLLALDPLRCPLFDTPALIRLSDKLLTLL